ncbi:SDR family NAD(P)-dependent oxidoreductase [Paenibacillus sambharensis]|uniref:dTDP-4-dehydrorhamnose reductase n=1 Tax=Paenibacillus sambharensis TaxID=1803190 RepID=A0A2W1LKY1_9BACL|nr:SDR family oxidoreductase [Paenibacillus sambharensis]PZD95144.1 SDR family NAD(P)-dependent oxidoreductase [Paenibacillus sambharensis]
MRMLVIGGRGMAGHMLVRYFRRVTGAQVFSTVRDPKGEEGEILLEATDMNEVLRAVCDTSPHYIVNAAGVLNQYAEKKPADAYLVNGLLPHWLRYAANEAGARLIHISSDCVFSGYDGGYTEDQRPDGVSVYAVTKAIGEVWDPRHLTIRTSIIGPEIRDNGIGLLQWFLKQQGTIKGYERVMWNGVTTLELAKAVHYAIEQPEAGGLVHLAAPEPVSKLELLQLFQRVWNRSDIAIEPDDAIRLDRTLKSTRPDWNYQVPEYRTMLEELAAWMEEN